MTRRHLLALAVAGAIPAAGYPTILEPNWLELTRTRIRLSRPLRGPIRVLHLSDLHASFVVPMPLIEQAITLGIAQKPDLIFVTGDFVTHRNGRFNKGEYVNALTQLAKAAPTYAVLGNHDGFKRIGSENLVENILRSSGITLLHNRSERVKARGSEFALVGVGDLWNRQIEADLAFAGVDGSLPTVLLSHNPDSKSDLGDCFWHVMLSGHTHGGQVIIPFEGPKYAPVQDKNYVAGLKPWRDRQIFVTRGVGNLGGVRFRCRPEVSVLELS